MEISEILHPSKVYAECFLDNFKDEKGDPGKKLRWLGDPVHGEDDPVHADLQINRPGDTTLEAEYKRLKEEVNIWNKN